MDSSPRPSVYHPREVISVILGGGAGTRLFPLTKDRSKPAVPLETLVAEGDPTESLVEASKGANLLVLGIRGRSRFAGLLLGSVSQGAAASAHCPVVLVKRSDEA